MERFEKYAWYYSVFILLLLLVLGSFRQMGGYGVETDFYWAYAPDAERLTHGLMPQEPGVGPGYSLTLAAFNQILHDWFVSGCTLSILSSIVCGLLTFQFIRNLFDAALGFYTLVLWHATVMPWALVASTDMFFAMLVAASIFALYRGGTISRKNLVLSGFLMGFTYLTRHNAVVLPIGVAATVFLFNPESWTVRDRLKGIAVFAAVFVLTNLPWAAIQMLSSGNAVHSDSYLIIASNFYGRPGVVSSEDMRIAAQKFNSLWSVVSYDFVNFVKHYCSNLYHHFYDVLINSLMFPSFLFVVAGSLLMLPHLNRRQASLFVFPGLSFLLLCLVHYEPRYYLYILSFLLVFVSYFLLSSELWSKEIKRWLVFTRKAAYLGTLAFLFLFAAKEIKANTSQEPRELLEISESLHGKLVQDGTVIARKPHFGFLSRLRTIYFPEAKTVADLVEFARQNKADYLIYGEMESKRRPELRELLQPSDSSGVLEPILIWESPRTVVYKFNFAPFDGALSEG